MQSFKGKKLLAIVIGTVFVLAAITYLAKNKIEIKIKPNVNDNNAVAETVKEGVSFAPGAEEHFKKGHQALKSKQLDEALKEFEKAAEMSPKTAVAQYWAGMTYFYKKEPERAIVRFKKVLDLEPNNYHALAMIGKILSFDKNKLDEAIIYLKKALAISPEYADAHFDLARVYAQKGDMNRALAEFHLIFRAEMRYGLYHYELGRIFESMKAADRAKNEYKRALQLNPRMTQAKEALERLESS
jgi:superkiller protein 3